MKAVLNKIANLPLYWKLFTAMAVVSLVPIIIILFVALILTFNTMQRQLIYDSSMSVEWLQERLEMEIEDYTSTFYEFEIDKDFRAALSEWCNDGQALSYHSQTELITTLNQTINVNSNINSIELYNIEQEQALIAARAGTSFTPTGDRLEYWLSRDAGLQTNIAFLRDGREIVLVHQMHHFNTGKPYAVIVMRLRAYFVQDILDAIKSMPEETLFLFNDQGDVIESDMAAEADYGPEEALEKAEALSGTSAGYAHDNECYWFYRSVSGGKLHIIQVMPDSAIRSSLKGALISGVIVAVLAIAFSVVFSLAISRLISRPIVDLAKTMRHSTFEDNMPQFPKREDEIGLLYSSFYTMQKQNRELVDSEYTSQIAKRSAQLHALQSQINPHFLYNTLQVVGAIAVRKKAPEIYAITTAMGDILRYSLNFSSETVALSEELHYFQSYLSIQKYRFGDKLKISVDVPPELEQASVPKLILQPILENSFIHGLPEKKRDWDISIKAYKKDEMLRITVSDNGIGIPQERLEEIRSKLQQPNFGTISSGKHIGLVNVNMRIRLKDGADPYGVDIQSVPGEGTTVILTMQYSLEGGRADESEGSNN